MRKGTPPDAMQRTSEVAQTRQQTSQTRKIGQPQMATYAQRCWIHESTRHNRHGVQSDACPEHGKSTTSLPSQSTSQPDRTNKHVHQPIGCTWQQPLVIVDRSVNVSNKHTKTTPQTRKQHQLGVPMHRLLHNMGVATTNCYVCVPARCVCLATCVYQTCQPCAKSTACRCVSCVVLWLGADSWAPTLAYTKKPDPKAHLRARHGGPASATAPAAPQARRLRYTCTWRSAPSPA